MVNQSRPGNIDYPHNGLILRESLFYSNVNRVSSSGREREREVAGKNDQYFAV